MLLNLRLGTSALTSLHYPPFSSPIVLSALMDPHLLFNTYSTCEAQLKCPLLRVFRTASRKCLLRSCNPHLFLLVPGTGSPVVREPSEQGVQPHFPLLLGGDGLREDTEAIHCCSLFRLLIYSFSSAFCFEGYLIVPVFVVFLLPRLAGELPAW